MMLWFVLALMTCAAVFAVLWPLGRRGEPVPAATATDGMASPDVAIYRDQLAEIERDRAAGLIGEAEAAAARIEVSRRLIAAAERPAPQAGRSVTARKAIALAALVALPLFTGVLYWRLGSPQLPDLPLSARRGATPAAPLADLVAKVEQHLAKNPDDGRGWEVIAPALMNLGRFDEAARAYTNAVRLNGETADRVGSLGEALMMQAGGVVSADARAAFERAHALDKDDPKAIYYLGIAAEQDGRPKDAVALWRGALDTAPKDAPYRALFERALARAGAPPPAASEPAPERGPSQADVAAAAEMTPEQRQQMIRTMVAGLAERLKQDGSDPAGWLRLIRAYMVMGDRDTARAAVADARKALAGVPDKLGLLNSGLKELGFDG